MIRENNKKKIFFTLAQTFKGHRGPVYSIACDDQFLYSSAGDKFVTRWNLITGEQDSFVIKLEHASYAIYTDRFSNYIHVACNDGTIHIVDKESRRLIYSVNIGKHKIFYLKERVSNKDLYIVNEVGACCVINIEKKQISIEQNSINAKLEDF